MIYDFIVIGAGIAGASAAYELAPHGSVLLIEAEAQPGYHSTGRSAALFTRNYGTPLVRKVNALSEPFFLTPPEGFTDRALLSPRGALSVAGPGKEALLNPVLAASTSRDPLHEMPVAEALERAPILRPERVARVVYEPGVTDIEVSVLLAGFLKGYKQRGGILQVRAPVRALAYKSGIWHVTAGADTYTGKTIVNAAGAWADQIGALAGAAPIGLVAKRRTAILLDGPQGMDVARMPCVDFAETDAYIKPDAGKLMVSPGDATPTEPQDAQPDELDVATLADWVMRETRIEVRRIAHSWAGLRSFIADGSPVVARDAVVPDFIWLAGQGGYGIMMAPALARVAAALGTSGPMPADFLEVGLSLADLTAGRASAQGPRFH